MNPYRYTWLDREGERICQLRDDITGSEADIVTTFGMNVIRFVSHGRDIVLQPPDLGTLRETPFRYGIPVLSPPGRTSKGRFVHRGVEYQLPITVGKHNVHGQIGTVQWRVLQWGVDADEGAFLTASYAYQDDPDQFSYFPHELEYRITYRLKEGKLSLEGDVSNGGERYAPFALGFHPYFHFTSERSEIVLQIPACSQWPVDREGKISGLPEPTRWSESLRDGLVLSELEGNLLYLQCDGSYRCRLSDKQSKHRIDYHVDGLFSVMVLFVPPWGNAVSLEPHTCIPDAWNLPLEGPKTGIQELAPGEKKQFGWLIDVQTME